MRIGGCQPGDAGKRGLPTRRIAFRPNRQALCRAKATRKHHRAIRRRCAMIRATPRARRIRVHAKIGKQLQLPGKGMARRAANGVSQAWRDGLCHALQDQRAIWQAGDAAEQSSGRGNGAARANAGRDQLFARRCRFQGAALRNQRTHARKAKVHQALRLQPLVPIAHHGLQ